MPSTKFIVQTTSEANAKASLKLFDLTDQKAHLLCFYDAYPNPANERITYALNQEDLLRYNHPNLQAINACLYARRQKDLHAQKSSHSSAMTSFEELALESTGKPLLGLLRMDVDNLGTIFAKGFAGKKTFTRLASLSRFLSLFFKTYLDRLLECKNLPEGFEPLDLSEKNPKQNGRNATVVYAGGDDLFIIGAWDDVAEISIDIQKAFTKFCGDNPNLTISGGFVVQHHDFPLYKLADLGHEAEKTSKESDKNRLTLFYDPNLKDTMRDDKHLRQTLEWQEIDQHLLEPIKELKSFGGIVKKNGRQYLEIKDISHNDLGKLLLLANKWQEEGFMYLPLFAYFLGRAKKAFPDSSIFHKLMNEKNIAFLRNSLLWIILLSRSNK